MSNAQIAELIQKEFEFTNTPSEDEVSEIIQKITTSTTKEEFHKIVLEIVSNTTAYCMESIDMSVTIDTLEQIKLLLNNNDS